MCNCKPNPHAEVNRLAMQLAGARYYFTRDLGRQIKWLGVWWYGVPMPIRAYLWCIGVVKPGKLPGCGCVVVLKDLWTKVRWV